MKAEPSTELINRLYNSALMPELQSEVLREINIDLNGSVALLFLLDQQQSGYSFVVEENMSPEIRDLYMEEFFVDKDIFHQLINHDKSDIIGALGEEFISDRALKKTEFYNEILKPDDAGQLLCCTCEHNARFTRVFSVSRPLGAKKFDQNNIHYARQLAPHVRRVFDLQRSTQQLRQQKNRIDALWAHTNQAVMLVDEKGKVEFSNYLAERILQEQSGLKMKGGHIKCTTQKDTQLLRRLIRKTALAKIEDIGGVISIRKNNGLPPLNIMAVPINTQTGLKPTTRSHKTIGLFIDDPLKPTALNSNVLRKLYGLTRAETQIVQLIYGGFKSGDVAKTLQIKVSTVRTHLHRIFDKTQTKNQVQLVSLLANGLATINIPN